MKWINQGLHFSCHQCGNCCTGEPGYIWVTPKEMKDLAKELHTDFDSFTRTYVKQVGRHYSLIEKENGDCILWNPEKGCTAYASRPIQCQTYPFWPEIVKSRRLWMDEAQTCQGIREGLADKGQFHSLSAIESQLQHAIRHDPQHPNTLEKPL